MSHTNFVLGDNWKNVWPDSINVIHEGTYLSRKYMPERICKIESFDNGLDEDYDGSLHSYAPPTYYLSCGHEAYYLKPNYCPDCGAKVVNQMKKRKLTLDRDNDKRVCECGGELKFLGVDYGFKPHTRCLDCGKEHIGLAGTKKIEDD